MTDVARARVIALVQGITPAQMPAEAFRHVDRGTPLKERAGESRVFELTEGEEVEAGFTYSTTPLWDAWWNLLVRYDLVAAGDREAVRARMNRDSRDIIKTLRLPGNWKLQMSSLDVNERYETEEIESEKDEHPVALIRKIPVKVQFFE